MLSLKQTVNNKAKVKVYQEIPNSTDTGQQRWLSLKQSEHRFLRVYTRVLSHASQPPLFFARNASSRQGLVYQLPNYRATISGKKSPGAGLSRSPGTGPFQSRVRPRRGSLQSRVRSRRRSLQSRSQQISGFPGASLFQAQVCSRRGWCDEKMVVHW